MTAPRRAGSLALALVIGILVNRPLPAMERPPALQPSAIAAARAYSDSHGGRALVIRSAGREILAHYANGGSAASAERLMSISKNLIVLAAFAAQADGILDLDETVAATISEWPKSGHKSRITLRQLLDQTSGLAPGNSVIYGGNPKGKTSASLALPAIFEPGTQFDYGAGNLEVFGEVLRRKLERRGTKPIPYLQTRVLRATGATLADWQSDKLGAPYYSTGARMTAHDLARIGELIRKGGRAGVLPVIPSTEFAKALNGSPANSLYGLTFWLNRNARQPDATPISVEGTLGSEWSAARWATACLSTSAPPDVIALIGSGGLRCYIVPSYQLVIVRFGQGSSFSDHRFLDLLFTH